MKPRPDPENTPLVSVVIPAFNHGQYISSCLDSVQASTYPELEVLVLDDGSKDNTYEVAQQWMDRNARQFRRCRLEKQDNQGVTRTLNRLVSLAMGEFVAVLASDDELLPDGITVRVQALQRAPHLLAVFGDCTVIDEHGKLLHQSALKDLHDASTKGLADPRFIARELILRWSVPGPAMLARADAYHPKFGVGPYNEELIVEDRDFYLRLLSRRQLGFVPVAVAQYRVHGANTVGGIGTWRGLRSDVVRSELDNGRNFSGIDRLCLRLVAARGHAGLQAMVRPTPVHRAASALARIAIAGLYSLHRVAVSLKNRKANHSIDLGESE